MSLEDNIEVVEWSFDAFHRKVLELEAKGYETLLSTRKIEAEMHPETGEISHRHSIQMRRIPMKA